MKRYMCGGGAQMKRYMCGGGAQMKRHMCGGRGTDEEVHVWGEGLR